MKVDKSAGHTDLSGKMARLFTPYASPFPIALKRLEYRGNYVVLFIFLYEEINTHDMKYLHICSITYAHLVDA